MAERFKFYKVDFSRKPWIVEDTASDRCEDPVLYQFSSAAKAKAFMAMLAAEMKAKVAA